MNAPATLARVRQHLFQLKLACALEVLDETMARVEQGQLTVLEAIDVLLNDECANRETRLTISQELGHEREQVTATYLGR